jgi:hypothetical protein
MARVSFVTLGFTLSRQFQDGRAEVGLSKGSHEAPRENPCPYWLAGEGSNLQRPDSKSGILPIELPAIIETHCNCGDLQRFLKYP